MYFFALVGIILLIFSCFPVHVRAFCFQEAGERYNISPRLLKSIAQVESGLNPRAVNKNPNGSTDIGLMQINSAWLRTINVTYDDLMNNACLNTMTGAFVLRQCIDRHGYTWEAVGCYNAYSREKRVTYAWKVFHKLKGVTDASNTAGPGAGRETRKSVAVKKAAGGRSSFVFHVRDAAGERDGPP